MQTIENDPAGVRVLELRPWIDIAPYLVGFDLISISVGPKGELWALAVTTPAEYREEIPPGGAIFAKIKTEQTHNFRVLRCLDDTIAQFDIFEQSMNFHHVQPLPENQLLFTVARSRFFANGIYDLNAQVFGEDGVFHRAFLLGDGIRELQTTANGKIWASYYDEGVFGNLGWDDPVGAPGLIQWDRLGNRLYEYVPPDGIGPIDDCYALNVVSDTETWCYYYSDFPLVRIRGTNVDAVWRCPVHGAGMFAIWQNFALFSGGYRERDVYRLFDLSDGGAMHLHVTLRFTDETGNVLQPDRVVSRGSMVFFLRAGHCYRLDIGDILRDV